MATEPEIKAWLQDLWDSLQRAGSHLSDEAQLHQEGERWLVYLRVAHRIPATSRGFVSRYVRLHGQERGFKVTDLRIDQRKIEFYLDP